MNTQPKTIIGRCACGKLILMYYTGQITRCEDCERKRQESKKGAN
jgi:hypothetical protein